MPRERNPANEVGRSAQERYRERLAALGGAETDAVDSAISAALAVWRHEVIKREQSKNLERIAGIEKMATSILVSKGKDPKLALRAVRLRTQRLDVEELLPLVGVSIDDGDPGSGSGLHGVRGVHGTNSRLGS